MTTTETMATTETIAAAINQIDEKKQQLKKAFDDLQSHRSLLSPSFSLSWSEIDSHFSSLQSSLYNRFRLLQSNSIRPELRALCENMDGIGLKKYLVDNWDDQSPPNVELSAAMRFSFDPASMVLDAIEGSNENPLTSSRKSVDVRKVFVLLMESLIEINSRITFDLRDRAKKLAYDWKPEIENKSFAVLLFLHLVAAFDLVSEFNSNELSEHVFTIARYKQATSVCNKIGLGKERVIILIRKLLESGKPILAVRFMYECKMRNGFNPIHILKSYIKDSREASRKLCVEDNNSLRSLNEATDKEVSALKAVIKIIKEQRLESEFIEERVEERVEELERQKAVRKRNTANPPSKRARVGSQVPAQSQQQTVLMHDPNIHGLQFNNHFGIVNPPPAGVFLPYANPLPGLYAPAPPPPPPPQSTYYGQQQIGFVLPPQYRPPY